MDVSALGEVHTLDLSGCKAIRDVSGSVFSFAWCLFASFFCIFWLWLIECNRQNFFSLMKSADRVQSFRTLCTLDPVSSRTLCTLDPVWPFAYPYSGSLPRPARFTTDADDVSLHIFLNMLMMPHIGQAR